MDLSAHQRAVFLQTQIRYLRTIAMLVNHASITPKLSRGWAAFDDFKAMPEALLVNAILIVYCLQAALMQIIAPRNRWHTFEVLLMHIIAGNIP